MKRGSFKQPIAVPLRMAAAGLGPAGPANPPPAPVDQRLTSFLERYLIERIGACKNENPLQDGWLVLQDGKKIYAMIQAAGSRGVQ